MERLVLREDTPGVPAIAMTMIDLLARIKQSYDDTDKASEAEIMKIYEDIRYEAYMPTIITTYESIRRTGKRHRTAGG